MREAEGHRQGLQLKMNLVKLSTKQLKLQSDCLVWEPEEKEGAECKRLREH